MTAHHDTDSGFRLSPQQRLRWQAALPAPTMTLDIKGMRDVEQLTARLQALATTHESLRAQLRALPGLNAPLQCPSAHGAVSIDTVPPLWSKPSSALPGDEGSGGIRGRLEMLAEGHYRLYLSLPPLSADRGTLLRLARALVAPVTQEQDGNALAYSHYTAWLYELQHDEDAEQGRQYWQRQCPPLWQPRSLAYRQNRAADAGLADSTLPADPRLDRALTSFCRTHDYSPEEVLLTAWGAVLQRLSKGTGDDTTAVPLGWVHDCREDYEELADIWGVFSKTLPLPWSAVPNESFRAALARLRENRDTSCEWQEYYAVDTDPDPAHSCFGFEWGGQLSMESDASTGIRIEVSAIRAPIQNFDLLLVPERNAQGELRFQLYYDASQYSARSASVLLEQYQSLLRDALTEPDQLLAALSLHSPAFDKTLESLQEARDWPALTGDDLYPAWFSRQAQCYPDVAALHDNSRDGAALNYRELDARSNRLAHHLRDLGIGPESRVALYMDRSADMVVAILGVLKSGGAFVPLEIHQPAARTLTIVEDANPDLLLCTRARPFSALGRVPQLLLDNLPLASCPSTAPAITVTPDNAAYVLFTSGSTGKPKGVLITHRQLHNYVNSILSRVPLNAGEKSAIVTSLAADLSYTLLFTVLLSGGELHIIDRNTTLDPQTWARYQRGQAIDHLKVVPSLLDAWLSHDDPAAVLPRRQLILGGETCKPVLLSKLRAAAPALQLYNHYGPTETTIGVMMHKVDAASPAEILPLSERLDHTHIYLLDEALKPVAPGQPGEVYIAGANLARGYLCPQQTAERFIRNPFPAGGARLYRSGDLARYFPDGSLELLGRADRQVKIRGFRIELDEVETLLSNLPAVGQAAVVAVPRQQGDLQMFAFVALKPGQQSSLAQIQGQLQDRLPDYMVPNLRLLNSLPLMSNGKLDRLTLCQQASKLLSRSGGTPPATPLERLLAGLWAEVLGLEKVGVDDDFFALGGHSLAAVKLVSRLQTLLATPVKVNMVFSAPTVAQFAELIKEGARLAPLVALSSDCSAEKPHLFCFHPSTGHLRDYRHLVEFLPQWQLWGLQAAYLTDDTRLADPASLHTLAGDYVAELRREQPSGPYYLLGWSLGGLLAITAAGQLEQTGEDVGFLGIVDSQPTPDETASSIDQLMQWAEEEFDHASRQRLRDLTAEQRASLLNRLNAVDPADWPLALGSWARQHGLHLENDSWQHAEARQRHYEHTQRLIRSFNPPRLHCPMTVWWAQETLDQLDAGKALPADWQTLTEGQVSTRIIASHHLDILQKKDWQQQLNAALHQAVSDYAGQVYRSQRDRSATTTDEVVW